MSFDYDPDKDAINRAKHGLGLGEFIGFDSDPVLVPDDRFDYGEKRYRLFGRINTQPHCVVLMDRTGRTRIISFRRAHEKELKRYEVG